MKNILNLKTLTISKENKILVKGTSDIYKALEEIDKSNKMTLKFKLSNISSEFEYFGLKIIVCDEPNIMIREILNNNEIFSKISINDNLIKNKYIHHIHPFSKLSDFLTNRSNGIFHEYLKKKDIEKVNLEFQDFITSKYYSLNDKDMEKISDVEFSKASLLDYIDISNEYINSENINNLLKILSKGYNGKQLILLNDYNILNIKEILNNYIGSFNFIVFTSDLKKWINDFTYSEFLVIINDFINKEFKIDALEILNKEILIKYIEKSFKNLKNKNKVFMNNFLE